MSNAPASTYLVWSIVSVLLLSFLLYHLYRFDRFQCLRWNTGPYSGAFKRFMTYTYLVNVPLIATFAIGYTVIKYKEGSILLPGYGLIPKPNDFWSAEHRRAVFPLNLAFSVAWSLEMVTHLEELCFWLFLVTSQRSTQQNWFRSPYFKVWIVGSAIAILYMPLVTIFTRGKGMKSEAYTFLAGGLGSFSLTLGFTPILWSFNSFLRILKREGVDRATIIRLTKFHELNAIRIFFRFLFTVPLIILGADGVRNVPVINTKRFAVELLTIVAAIGCGVSSGLTLVIFFPRSVESEITVREGLSSSLTHLQSDSESVISRFELPEPPSYPEESAPKIPTYDASLPPLHPNRKRGSAVELGGIAGDKRSSLNPMVHNFRSPIDMDYRITMARDRLPRTRTESRLTFNHP